MLLAVLCPGVCQALLLSEIRVDGNTVLSTQDVERAVYPFLGPDATPAKVEAAAQALEALYRERGYPTVGVVVTDRIDDQLRRGFARLEVFEQRVDRLRVRGGQYFSNAQVRAGTPSVRPGQVLNAEALQQDLDLIAARSADRFVRPVVRAGRAPGLLDVELQVEDSLPLHGAIELNNFASANTSDLRLTATLEYQNLFQRQHGLSFSYQTAPQDRDDVEVFSARYLHRFANSRTVLSVTGVTSDSSVASVADTTVLGEGEFILARAIVPLRASGSVQDSIIFGADYKRTRDVTSFVRDIIEGITGEEVNATALDYVNLNLGYQISHMWRGARNVFSVALNAGVRQFGNEREEFETKRFKGEPNYLYLKLGASRSQPLGGGWLLDLDFDAQLTGDQLISNEQLSTGGFNSVRGYLEAERLADYGFVSRVALSAPLIRTGGDAGVRLLPYLFWNGALGRSHEPLPDQDSDYWLSSAGFGLRLLDFSGLTAEASWAHVFEDGTQTEAGDDHFSFRIAYGF